LIVVPASIVVAVVWLLIGVMAGRSFAADAAGSSLTSAFSTTGHDRPLAPASGEFHKSVIGDGDLGPLSPITRAGASTVGQPPLGVRDQAGPAGLQPGCDGPCEVGEFSSVSCASATTCTAVGTALGDAPLAEGWDGTSWKIEPTPTPTGSTYSTLDGVSCTAATACLAVGFYHDSGTGSALPLAESWNGSSWTIRPPPTPSGATDAYFYYVQCGPVGHPLNACMAVGGYDGGRLPLVEFWDGSGWTIQTAPFPTGATVGALLGVSCLSTTACTAVGEYSTAEVQSLTLAEFWDGSNWTIEPTPNPTGAAYVWLKAVWCESTTSCIAVGNDLFSGPLSESWNGTSWTLVPVPAPSGGGGFANVSCAPAGTPCKAVGSSGNGTLAESWDGTSWTIQPPASTPEGSTQASFSDVSCTSATACTAVGDYLTDADGASDGAVLTLAEHWDGTSWTVQSTPDPPLALTADATSITSSSATLNGLVNPNGAAVTNCHFEYGTTTSFGSSVPCAQSVGGGPSPVAVSANLADLTPNTTYYMSVVATNAGGTAQLFDSFPFSFTTSAGGGGGPPPLSSEPVRQVVFVHGIRADCEAIGNNGRSYAGLYGAMQSGGLSVYSFCYAGDNAFGGRGSHPDSSHPPLNSARCFSDSSRVASPYDSTASIFSWNRGQATSSAGWAGPLSVTGNAITPNDGDGPLAYDAAKLDDCLTQLEQWDLTTFGRLVPIAVVGNSMGGAITRGWLQLAKSRAGAGTAMHSLDGVTTVAFLQGAIEGSWLAKVGNGVDVGLSSGTHAPGPLDLSGAIDSWARKQATAQDLNPTRGGVKDLVPGSAWYRSIVAAGPPPTLHYFSLSADIHLNFYWQVLFWTHPGPSTDFIGDGLMQLGDPAASGRPQWGGSEFLPFGASTDQQQWVFDVNLVAPLNLNGILAILDGTLHQPYGHFNFGDQIGRLTLASCAAPHPTLTIPDEIARIFTAPAQACTASAASQRSVVAGASTSERPPAAASNIPTARAAAHEGPVGFINQRYDAQLSVTTARGPKRGEFQLSLPGLGTLIGKLPARQIADRPTIHLHAVVLAVHGAAAVRIVLRGMLRPSRHSARLAIKVGHHRAFSFVTAAPSVREARRTARRLLDALKRDNLRTLVALLPRELLAGAPPSAVAEALAAEHIRITSIRPTRSGRPAWLANGSPIFEQSVVAKAQTPQGRRTAHATLLFIYEAGAWRLLSSS
jgi:hypothetical protein